MFGTNLFGEELDTALESKGLAAFAVSTCCILYFLSILLS
jgi:hypothetical protein